MVQHFVSGEGGGGGEERVFHHQGSTFYGGQYGSNDLPRPRRSALWVLLSVCLSVCWQHYSKCYKRIGRKVCGRVLGSTTKNWLNFSGDPGILRWVNEQKNTIMGVVVQWLDYTWLSRKSPGVRFPATAEKCHLMWRCPSGHGIKYSWRRVLQTW